MEVVVKKYFQHSSKNSRLKFCFHFSVVYTFESAYLSKLHLAANEIIFHVIRGCNGTVRILVKANLCIIWLSSGVLYVLSTFETVSQFLLTFLITIITFQQIKVFTKSVIKK